MNKLQNYALGQWISGEGNGQELYNAINQIQQLPDANRMH